MRPALQEMLKKVIQAEENDSSLNSHLQEGKKCIGNNKYKNLFFLYIYFFKKQLTFWNRSMQAP